MLLARRKGREVVPGTLVGVFVLYYGVMRFLSDSLRVNDERVLSMTGAQWMCLALVPAGIWILWKVRPGLAALAAAEPAAEAAEGTADDDDESTGGATATATATDDDSVEDAGDDSVEEAETDADVAVKPAGAATGTDDDSGRSANR